ncbi:unnamed protein product, partial [Ranitomeya imitator]
MSDFDPKKGIHQKENGRCITKLENMGFRVGQGLIERFTKDTARFKDELDIMKFVCKDFWTTVFKKQIDNLRTNHQVTSRRMCCHRAVYFSIGQTKYACAGAVAEDQKRTSWNEDGRCRSGPETPIAAGPPAQGIYVLQDNKFRLITQMSAGKQYLEHAPK